MNYNTASKHPSQWVKGTPQYCEDIRDPKKDFVCGLGCNLIGWQNTRSLPTAMAVSLAQRLREKIPMLESIRLLKTGSDACSAAVRIARAHTENRYGTENCWGIGTGYHGWHNVFVSEELPGTGTVDEFYQKMDNLDDVIVNIDSTLSYCIIEPLELDLGVKRQVKEIRRLCTHNRVTLIFDEVITGFRVPGYTVSQMWGIEPDLLCLGKALGNGHSISVVGGREELMETEGYFVSGTFFEEQSGIAEALRTLDTIGLEDLDKLWHKGANFMRCFNILSTDIQLKGYPTRAVWEGDDVYKFQQVMNMNGWVLGKAFFLNMLHDQQILEQFLSDSRAAVDTINKGYQLQGPEPTPIFKR